MELKAAQCPNCGGELQLPDNKDKVVCMYCDTSIVVRQAIEKKQVSAGSIGSWLEIAHTAEAGGNFEEAIKYYNKILEVDPKHAEAWLRKGVCITGMFTIDKLKESLPCFVNAVKYANDQKKKEVAALLNSTSMKAYDFCRDGYEDDIYGIECCLNILKLATESDNQELYLNNAFVILQNERSSQIPNYDTYKEYFIKKKKELDPDWEEKVNRALYNKEGCFIQCLLGKLGLVPDWEEKKEGCFIATATTGDHNHPIVMDLRLFRDQWLVERSWGREFISFYYRYSPYWAKVIEKSNLLKNISYFFIIKPLYIFIKLFRIYKKQIKMTEKNNFI